MATPNSDDVDRLTNMLSALEPGELPVPVFFQIARLMVVPTVELVPLRMIDGKAHVLMLQREASDPIWPGQWHTPGRVLRIGEMDGDRGLSLVFSRLLERELDGVRLAEPVFVCCEFRRVQRGPEFTAVHLVEVLDDHPNRGTFFPLDDLPESVIDHQLAMIHKAGKHYLEAIG